MMHQSGKMHFTDEWQLYFQRKWSGLLKEENPSKRKLAAWFGPFKGHLNRRVILSFVSKPTAHLMAIIILVILSYSNTFDVPFQLDDIGNIVSSPAVKDFSYFSDLSRLGPPRYGDDFNKPLFRSRYVGFLTFALNYAVNGLDVRGYHLVNILIHLCTSLLLYRLIVLTFRTPLFLSDDKDGDGFPVNLNFIAFFATLLFAVHPIQTQAVTYIVQRFASLATMLCLLSLVSYVQFRLSTGRIRQLSLYSISLVTAVLAMKTKEFALLLPLVICLYEFMFLKESLVKRARYLTPLCMTTVIIPLSLINTGAGKLSESAAKISDAFGGITRTEYLFTQFRVVITYLRLLFFPLNQRFDYDYAIYHSFFEYSVIFSFLVLFLILMSSVYLYYISKSYSSHPHLYRLISFGILWFFITISAESSVIPIADVIFEHRLYLPSIGFFLALVSAIELLRMHGHGRTPYLAVTSVCLMLAVAAGLSGATHLRNATWRDRIGFLENEVRLSPYKTRPRHLLGDQYGEHGRMEEAIKQFTILAALHPDYGGSYYSLGVTYMRMGRLEEAVQEYKKAIAIKFDSAEAHSSLGGVYELLGRMEDAANERRIVDLIQRSTK